MNKKKNNVFLNKRRAHRAGRRAEFFAVWLLRAKAYRIVARNYKPPHAGFGKIDIIARRGRVLVFVEVKYRPAPDAAMAAIAPRQWQRIARSAGHFVAAHKVFHAHLWRFDSVLCAPRLRLRHIADCWRMR